MLQFHTCQVKHQHTGYPCAFAGLAYVCAGSVPAIAVPAGVTCCVGNDNLTADVHACSAKIRALRSLYHPDRHAHLLFPRHLLTAQQHDQCRNRRPAIAALPVQQRYMLRFSSSGGPYKHPQQDITPYSPARLYCRVQVAAVTGHIVSLNQQHCSKDGQCRHLQTQAVCQIAVVLAWCGKSVFA